MTNIYSYTGFAELLCDLILFGLDSLISLSLVVLENRPYLPGFGFCLVVSCKTA